MGQLILEHVSKKFGTQTVLHDFSLTIEEGEFMVLAGPSGCGKSTILRLIAGLEECDSGQIILDQQRLNDVQPKDRDIAMVFQNYALYPHMTAFENMAFGLKIRGMEKKEINRRVQEAADILDIAELLDRKPAKMSGGQRQRVAIGRAIVREPRIFLFDEPLSNLDAALRTQMRYEIASLHKRLNATIIYVTHDQVEAMTLADRITVLKKGEWQQTASPANIYQHPGNLFVAGFIGSPPMNFIEGELNNQDGSLKFQSLDQQIAWPIVQQLVETAGETRKIVVGCRPEDLTFNPVAGSKTCIALPVEITHTEWQGFDGIAMARLHDTVLRIRFQRHEGQPKEGKKTVYLDIDRCHYFDKITGKALI